MIQLFYTAFWELDIVKLRSQLVAIYTVDTVRRAATEAVLPYVMARRALILQWARIGEAKKTDGGGDGGGVTEAAASDRATAVEGTSSSATTTTTTSVSSSSASSSSSSSSSSASSSSSGSGQDTRGDEVAQECALDEYEQFDDYLEMVIQLGYIQLFAAAFPLAAPLSLVANFVEIRCASFFFFLRFLSPACSFALCSLFTFWTFSLCLLQDGRVQAGV